MIIKQDKMTLTEREHMRDGKGKVLFQNLMEQGTIKHCRLFSKLTLNPGCSIGQHEHNNETEYYWILSGKGIVSESDGEKKVEKGDMVVTGNGASHAIRNTGDEPLVFLALIILD